MPKETSEVMKNYDGQATPLLLVRSCVSDQFHISRFFSTIFLWLTLYMMKRSHQKKNGYKTVGGRSWK